MPNFHTDKRKSDSNRRKHGLFLEDAIPVFDDLDLLTRYDRYEGEEDRYHAIGKTEGVVLLVVFSCLDDDGNEIRLISARKATPHERRAYYAHEDG